MVPVRGEGSGGRICPAPCGGTRRGGTGWGKQGGAHRLRPAAQAERPPILPLRCAHATRSRPPHRPHPHTPEEPGYPRRTGKPPTAPPEAGSRSPGPRRRGIEPHRPGHRTPRAARAEPPDHRPALARAWPAKDERPCPTTPTDATPPPPARTGPRNSAGQHPAPAHATRRRPTGHRPQPPPPRTRGWGRPGWWRLEFQRAGRLQRFRGNDWPATVGTHPQSHSRGTDAHIPPQWPHQINAGSPVLDPSRIPVGSVACGRRHGLLQTLPLGRSP